MALCALAVAGEARADSNSSAPALGSAKSFIADALRKADVSAATEIRLLPISPGEIDAAMQANAAGGKSLQIGIGRIAFSPASDSAALRWERVAGGHVAHWQVRSPGAKALRVGLEALGVADGIEIRFVGDASPTVIYGPFGAGDLKTSDPTYWSPVLQGERALVELFAPEGLRPADVDVALTLVSHLFVDPADPKAEWLAKNGSSGSCEVDLVCRSSSDVALANAGKAVAKMVFTRADASSGLCTGTLLNPLGTTYPYLYSSYDCFNTQSEATTLTTWWFNERSTCSTTAGAAGVQLAGGATLLHASATTRALFVKLNASPPAGTWYAGWQSAALTAGTPLTSIHHPQGDWKKVSIGSFNRFEIPSGATGSFSVVDWTSGVTEYGSIGGAIFSAFGNPVQDYRLRGGLYTGPSGCGVPAASMYDWFSRFDQVYPSISQWLSPPLANYTLSVSKAGTGTGVVSSTTAAMVCGASCSASLVSGTVLSVQATPTTGSSFAGWGGACSGTGACQVTMDAAKSVTATFVASGTPAVSAGSFYECAVSDSGALSCWGDNGSGKLGTGEPINSVLPLNVGGAADSLASIQATHNHTCALATDGRVLCWGGNYFGELGNDTFTSSSTPSLVKGLPGAAVAIAVGRSHNCALISGGAVYCWGINLSGQLGNGQVGYHGGVPVAVQGLSGAIAISAGSDHSCAIVAAGAVRCWGNNSQGQLGNGTTTASPVPVAVNGLAGVTSLSAGRRHTCAVTAASTLHCWGANDDAQLGNGLLIDTSAPIQIAAATAFRSVSAGDYYTCAITQAGALQCWGTNYFNAVGTGAPANTRVLTPTALATLGTGVTMVSTSRSHACAIKAPGNVYCWGENDYGGIGDSTTNDAPTPVQVLGLPAGITVVAAGNLHSCALTAARRALCWGYNADGQLGGGTPVGRATPVAVLGLQSGVLEVQTAVYHTCALNSSRGAMCWGRNGTGQLGNNTETTTSTPVAVQGLSSGVATLAVGGKHSCALNSVGEVFCWGDNTEGQLGNGTTTRSSVPVKVSNLAGIIAISAGWSHSCAVAYQGSVYCWGRDSNGALGLGTTTATQVPALVTGLPTNITAISGKLYHQCALAASGEAWCWGNNTSGQLGNGSFTNSSSPVRVQGLSPAARLSVGNYHNCAVSFSGGVSCWGYGGFGQLGDGYAGSSTSPVQAMGLASGGIAVAAGTESCAVTSVGAVLCWGQSNFGQLGDGTYVWRAKPVTVLARLGAGTLDTNDWYLDLVPSKAKAIDPALTPRLLSISQLALAGEGVDFESRLKYKTAEFGRSVNNYVFGFVPPQFFSIVKTAPGARTEAQLRAKSGSGLVFAILTPLGWTNLQGQLLAYSTGVASAVGGATNILSGVRIDLIPGARFCVGYGASVGDMLTSDTFREVLLIEGTTATVEDRPCVLSGVYLDGPRGSRFGSPVTFVASVVGLSPTGSVNFLDGGIALSSRALVDSGNAAVKSATITTAALVPGVHAIGAAYSGDSQNPAISATILRHEVTPTAATTRVELEGPRDSLQGKPVYFWVTVSGSNPTGSVQFKNGASNLGAPVPLLAGTATARVDGLALGSHSITAAYAGDSGNTANGSNVLVHNVYAAVNTTITLASSANPAAFGAPVTFTASVSGSNPGGQVTFREGATVLARVGLANGTASASVTGLTQGQHLIEADYSGDGTNQAVTSDVLMQAINSGFVATSPNVFLSAAPNPSTLGQTVTFSAVVSGSTGAASGSVAFKLGAGTLCNVAVTSAGTASCSTGALPAGVHLVTALYSGDSKYVSTLSSLLSQTVASAGQVLSANPATLDFGVRSVASPSQAQVVTLTNPTGNPIVFSGTALPDGIEAGSVNTCSASLAPGATCQRSFVFRPTFAGAISGSIVITYAGGATVISVNAAGDANPPRLANISTRMQVLTGNDVMIAGFIIGGTVAKTVVVNVAGPSLSAHGITNPLANPKLTLVRSADSAIIATNDNWQSAANSAQILASGFQPANPLEPAIMMTLGPGAYTAIVEGVGGTGIGLVGVFEVDHPEVPLINISTRGQVLTGNDVMIAGFIIQGSGPQTVVVNVAGPSLSAHGITNPLANPTLTLVRSSDNAIIATNDNWQAAANAAAIQASGFQPANPLEPAIMMTLAPGAYTAIVQGVGGTGVGLVGVFRVP